MPKSADQRPRPHAARGYQTRTRLLAASVQLVAELGWDAVTTRRIADRAGVNQALIHYHFRNKEGLLQAAVAGVLRDGFGQPVQALVDAPILLDGVAALLRELSQMDHADPMVRFSIEAMARSTRDPALQRVMAGVLADLRTQLEAGVVNAQQRGELPAGLDAGGAGALLGAVFDGLGLHLLIDPSLDVERAGSALRLLLAGPTGAR